MALTHPYGPHPHWARLTPIPSSSCSHGPCSLSFSLSLLPIIHPLAFPSPPRGSRINRFTSPRLPLPRDPRDLPLQPSASLPWTKNSTPGYTLWHHSSPAALLLFPPHRLDRLDSVRIWRWALKREKRAWIIDSDARRKENNNGGKWGRDALPRCCRDGATLLARGIGRRRHRPFRIITEVRGCLSAIDIEHTL